MGAVLVTGAAGFVGSHVCELLLGRGERVVGVDNFDPYYDPQIKRRTAAALAKQPDFRLRELDICDAPALTDVVRAEGIDRVVHLAALAGVRASIPRAAEYARVNLGGTVNVLEAARAVEARQVVFASTSSVYGATTRIPFVEDDVADRPLAPYPATKRAAELMAHAYHNLFGLNVSCVRLFTAYGPRVRPDMMLYLVAESAVRGSAVTMFGDGEMRRDWTFVGDIARGIVSALDRPLGYEVFNLGRGEPVLLADFVRLIEGLAGRPAHVVHRPAPPSEPPITFADIGKARRLLDYRPAVPIEAGLERFWEWFQNEI